MIIKFLSLVLHLIIEVTVPLYCYYSLFAQAVYVMQYLCNWFLILHYMFSLYIIGTIEVFLHNFYHCSHFSGFQNFYEENWILSIKKIQYPFRKHHKLISLWKFWQRLTKPKALLELYCSITILGLELESYP